MTLSFSQFAESDCTIIVQSNILLFVIRWICFSWSFINRNWLQYFLYNVFNCVFNIFCKIKINIAIYKYFFLNIIHSNNFFLFSTTIDQILKGIFSKNKCFVLIYWIKTKLCFVVLNSKKIIFICCKNAFNVSFFMYNEFKMIFI